MRARTTRAQERRAALIGAVAAILDRGEPTRFAFESACRHGLRIACVLHGWPWRTADDYAAGVVADAFKRMGVARPRWIDGQPEIVEPIGDRLHCIECGKGLEHTPRAPQRKFCDVICRTAHQARRRQRAQEGVSRAEWRARLAAEADVKRPIRDCEECGASFRPRYDNPGARFCGRGCVARMTARTRKPRRRS